ncbi:MAG: glycosyltransferase [Pseudomonadota bacterium]
MAETPYALRILHVMRTPIGGLFRHVCDLVEEQAKAGCHVGLICDSDTGGPRADQKLAELEKHLALGLHRFPIPRNPGLSDLKAGSQVTGIRNAVQPDIVHGHGAKGGAFARLTKATAKKTDRPFGAFYTPHGGALHYDPKSLQGRVFFGFERWAMKHTAAILFESHYGRGAFSRKIGEPTCAVAMVHNGLRPEEFAPVPTMPEPYDILYIGEMRTLKGVDTLLHAIAKLKATHPEVRALLVGSGPDEDDFRALATKLDLLKTVYFSPPMPAREAFSQARLAVVPSRNESLPYVVLEACASGLPVIATNVGGISEIFGEQGYRLISPDDPDTLTRTMSEMLDSLPEAQERAKQMVLDLKARFSVEKMTQDILRAYGEYAHLSPETQRFFADLSGH